MQRYSRRELLRRGSLTVVGGTLATVGFSGPAEAKMSQADAKYKPEPSFGRHCVGCVAYIRAQRTGAEGTCRIVVGSVSANGWCKYYAGA